MFATRRAAANFGRRGLAYRVSNRGDPKRSYGTVQMNLLSLWRGGLFIGHSIVRCGLPFARFRCGDADAHLEGRCRCCGGHEQSMERHGTGEKCPTILERLRADVAALVKDFSALAGPLELAAMAKQSVELRRGVFLTASDLQQICESFERVDRAVVGFRRTCALLDLSSALKSAAPSCESAVSGSAPFSKMISHELGVTKETAPRA